MPERAGSGHAMEPGSVFGQLGEAGKQGAQAVAEAQQKLFAEFQGIGQHWVARAKSEADLASELIAKLTAARSVPESAAAYQEWATRRMQLTIEDSQRLFADGLKLMETSTRLFPGNIGGRRD